MSARPGWGWWIACAAAILAAFAQVLPAPLAAALLAPTLLVTPGAVVARRLFAGAFPETRVLAALALSPFLTGAPFALLLVLHAPPLHAARAIALAVALAAALAWRHVPRGRSPASHPAIWLIALAWSAIVAGLFWANPWLAPRSDGWFNAGVALQIAQRGAPPEDPYWAGLRLLYFWGADAWAALWLPLAPRLAVWTPLVLFNVSAAFASVLGVATLARRLGADPRRASWAALLAVGGYAPLAWLQIAGRAAVGEVRGWAEVLRQVNTGVDALLGTLAAGQLHASLAFFGDKFLVPTAFGMGLALFALAMAALGALSDRPSARGAAALAVTLAAALYTHTVVGYAALLTCGAWWLERVYATMRGDDNARDTLAALALAQLAAVAVTSPYLAETALGKHGAVAVGFRPVVLRSFVLGGALFVAPGFAWLARRAPRALDARLALVAALGFALLALAVRLPENNQSKFLNLLFLVLAAPAALGWSGLAARLPAGGRALLTTGLLTATVPTVVLALWGFAAERGQSASTWAGWSKHSAEFAAMNWVREHTAPNAVLCDVGGARAILAVAGRSVFWGGPSGERDWGYAAAELQSRRELVTALCSGRDPAGKAAALWAAQRRSIYVVVRAGREDAAASVAALRARSERFALAYADSALSLWHVRSAP